MSRFNGIETVKELFHVDRGQLFCRIGKGDLTRIRQGDVEIPVVVSGRRLSFGSNKYKAAITSSSSSGQVKVSYQVGGKTYMATGIIYTEGGQSKVFGGGTLGDESFAVAIE